MQADASSRTKSYRQGMHKMLALENKIFLEDCERKIFQYHNNNWQVFELYLSEFSETFMRPIYWSKHNRRSLIPNKTMPIELYRYYRYPANFSLLSA